MNNEQKEMKSEENLQSQPPQAQKDGVVGPIIGSLIVIILIVIGGIYYLNSVVSKNSEKQESQGNPSEINIGLEGQIAE